MEESDDIRSTDLLDGFRDAIICGDNVKVMGQMPAASIDLVLTSPPYGDLREYGGCTWNLDAVTEQIARMLKPGGVCVWVVGDETDETGESGESFRHAMRLKQCGLRLHDTMIYEKAGPSYPTRDKYYQVFEYMFVLSKGKPAVVNLLKDRKNRWHGQKWSKVRTRRKRDGSLTVSTWDKDEGNEYGVRFNIWRYAVGAGNHGDEIAHEHPATFPEQLASDHIQTWTNAGATVLDCFSGSGTTAKMAKELERHYIGIDVNPEYCKLAERRLVQDVLRLSPPNVGTQRRESAAPDARIGKQP
jgi:site-specific DNA-methyltransferase (adenine-specific)